MLADLAAGASPQSLHAQLLSRLVAPEALRVDAMAVLVYVRYHGPATDVQHLKHGPHPSMTTSMDLACLTSQQPECSLNDEAVHAARLCRVLLCMQEQVLA